jgi:hypothetical protein
MAFNPFHGFRKYRKMIFAIMTIVCMFIFVLSSGLGGRADLLNRTFGGKSNPNTVEIATLNGKKIDRDRLGEIVNRRQLANFYMQSAVNSADRNILERILKRANDIPMEDIRNDVTQMAHMKMATIADDPRFQQIRMQALIQYRFNPQTIPQFVARLKSHIDRLVTAKRDDDADLLKVMQRMCLRDLAQSTETMGELYFPGTLRSTDDVLDFLVWLTVADQRGIKLNAALVKQLVKDETLNELTDEDSISIQQRISKSSKLMKSPEDLLEALGDEFRVRIAQAAVMGQSRSRSVTPAYVTPHEFLSYFRDVRKTIRVAMLPVKVENYLAQVTGTPSDDELKKLFEQYKKIEPAPEMDSPGFKDPRRVKIDWVAGQADLPAFRKAGVELGIKNTVATAAALFGVPMASSAAPWVIGVADDGFPKLPERRLETEYRAYLSRDRSLSWTHTSLFFFGVHESSVIHPETVASTIMSLTGSIGTGAPAMTPACTFGSQVVAKELRERVRMGMAAFAGATGNPWAVMGSLDGAMPFTPLAAVRDTLMVRVNEDLAKERFRDEMLKFQDEIRKRGKEAKTAEKKTELKKYIDDFVKTWGLQFGGSKEFRDQFSLADDPGLTPLKEAYRKSPGANQDPTNRFFGNRFIAGYAGATPLYEPDWIDGMPFGAGMEMQKTFYMGWKVDEQEPKVPTFEAARAQVEAAWKYRKARELALEAAKKLQDDARNLKGLAALKDLAAQQKLDLIELGPMAKENKSLSLTPTAPVRYEPYQIPQDKVLYPTRDFVTQLLDLRDKPIGETILLNDQPRSRYFVAYLYQRDEASDDEFLQVYQHSLRGDPQADPLMRDAEDRHRRTFRQEFMEQLRAEVKLKVNRKELESMTDRGAEPNPETE